MKLSRMRSLLLNFFACSIKLKYLRFYLGILGENMPKYDKIFEIIAERWVKESTEMRPSEVPGIVYHYTNAAGIEGFLKSGKLWLTDFRFLNDSAEFTQSIEIMRRIIIEKRANCIEVVSKLYERIDTYSARERKSRGYVFSLTAERDDLSQWRGYANEGMGFTIGFSGELLHKASENDFNFSKVSYDENSEKIILEKALKEIEAKVIEEYSNNSEDEEYIIADAANNFSWLARDRAAYSKHPSFSSEKEFRLVTFRDSMERDIKVRVSGDRLVPYVELKIDGKSKLPIECIGVGPGFRGAEVVDAVRSLAKMYGYDPKIYFAETPYRRP